MDIQTQHSGLSAGAVANLLGIEGKYVAGGFRPKRSTGPFAPTLFTPEAYEQMIGYATREPTETPLGGLAEELASPSALRKVWEDYMSGAGDLQGTLSEGLTTGFLTDIAPMEAYYRRQFERETIPQLAEEFAGTSGLSSSDFGRAVAEAGSDLAAQFGALRFGAEESAAARRAQMAALAPQIQAGLLSAPTDYASSVLGLSGRMEPGQRLLQTFLALSGIDTGGQTFVEQPSSGTGGILSGVGGLLGGAADVAGLFAPA